MILPNIILPSVSPAAWIFAPFLHHFCAMKCNSKLYRSTPGKASSKSQLIVSEWVASKHGFGKRLLVKKR
jgi:hypothetical protein